MNIHNDNHSQVNVTIDHHQVERDTRNMFGLDNEDHQEMVVLINREHLGETTVLSSAIEMTTKTASSASDIIDNDESPSCVNSNQQQQLQQQHRYSIGSSCNYENDDLIIVSTTPAIENNIMRVSNEAQLNYQSIMVDDKSQEQSGINNENKGLSAIGKKVECSTFTKRQCHHQGYQTYEDNENQFNGAFSSLVSSLTTSSSHDSSPGSGQTLKYEFVSSNKPNKLIDRDQSKQINYYYEDYGFDSSINGPTSPINSLGNNSKSCIVNENNHRHLSFKSKLNLIKDMIAFSEPTHDGTSLKSSSTKPVDQPTSSTNCVIEDQACDTLPCRGDDEKKIIVDDNNNDIIIDCPENSIDAVDFIEEEEANSEFDYHHRQQNEFSLGSQQPSTINSGSHTNTNTSNNNNNNSKSCQTTTTTNSSDNDEYHLSIARHQYDLYHAIMATTVTTDTSSIATSSDNYLLRQQHQQQQQQNTTAIAMLPPRSLAVASPINEEDELLSSLASGDNHYDHNLAKNVNNQTSRQFASTTHLNSQQNMLRSSNYNERSNQIRVEENQQKINKTTLSSFTKTRVRPPSSSGQSSAKISSHADLGANADARHQVQPQQVSTVTDCMFSSVASQSHYHENDNLIEEYSMGESQHYHNSIVAHQQKMIVPTTVTTTIPTTTDHSNAVNSGKQIVRTRTTNQLPHQLPKSNPMSVHPDKKDVKNKVIASKVCKQSFHDNNNKHNVQANPRKSKEIKLSKQYRNSNQQQGHHQIETRIVMASIDFGTNICKYNLVESTSSPMPVCEANIKYRELIDNPLLEIRFHEEEPMALLLKVVSSSGVKQIDHEFEFVSFGQAALNSYFEESINKRNQQQDNEYILYYQFKQQLLDLSIRPIEKIQLRSMDCLYELNGVLVLSHCLRYIASRVSMYLRQGDNVRWIIAVPNEWPIKLRQMMRMAAEEAGLTSATDGQSSNDNLLLVSDIEAVSYYCMSTLDGHLSLNKSLMPEIQDKKSKLDLIVLCNNRSLSWCLVKTLSSMMMRCSSEPSSINTTNIEYVSIEEWNDHGINLINEFLNLIISVFGRDFVQYFKHSQPKGFFDLINSFETSANGILIKNNIDYERSKCKLSDNNKDNFQTSQRLLRSNNLTPQANEFDLSKHSIEVKLPDMFVETFKDWICRLDKQQQELDAHNFLAKYIEDLPSSVGFRYDRNIKLLFLNYQALIVIYASLIDGITKLIERIYSTHVQDRPQQQALNIANIFVVGCDLIKFEPLVKMSINESLKLSGLNFTKLHMISPEAVTVGTCLFNLAVNKSSSTYNNKMDIFIHGWPCVNSLGLGIISCLESSTKESLSNPDEVQFRATKQVDTLDRMIHVGEIVNRGQVCFRKYYKRALTTSKKPILLNIYTTQTKAIPLPYKQQNIQVDSDCLSEDPRIMQLLTSLELKYVSPTESPLFELELTALERAQFQLKAYQVKMINSNLMRIGDQCLESLIIEMNV